ncbi:Mariner Mos1 transposase [Eumeta japonica]|uniref:Mariner Mos1 transposase n=1 Tax=Eumeta variegata TaxID=151549 RepID=A0A4C1Z422_EUMVA|nr:Mariner Mos1 transposase [Eumeta japonica]
MPFVLEKVREKGPCSRILLHHDNASPHTAKQTTNYLGTFDIEILVHQPYRADLAQCDSYLFPKIKKNLEESRLQTPRKQWLHTKRPSKRSLNAMCKVFFLVVPTNIVMY